MSFSPPEPRPLRVMFWGTYDLSKPRTRILLSGLAENGVQVEECRAPVWEDVRDKGTLGAVGVVRHVLRVALAYPRLIAEFCKRPAPDVVVVGYPGQLDLISLFPFARLRGVPIVWDQFISIYDTVVGDRQKLSSQHPLARALYWCEWVSCRLAACVLMDTAAHAAYVTQTFGLKPGRVQTVWVGVEVSLFPPLPQVEVTEGALNVLFYGQFIPLHGIDTIVRAARLLEGRPIRFLLIGSGQEEQRVRQMLSEWPLSNLEWHAWVEYERLSESIRRAHVCLGIFGRTAKAARVIPNKVFQIIAARRPLVTLDSPAIRELIGSGAEGVHLVPAADPEGLAELLAELAEGRGRLSPPLARQDIEPPAIGRQLLAVLTQVVGGRVRPPC